ncbi:pyridoxal-5'-phosphate-dependent protein subunit beta [Halobiforma lacisalsi AJ5]|uniref:Pyridoxal-5'-phosphate-dependent protein subunit beta n=1 Tax=Natronobacterium lacisalsi AJ5 TaxID=358396 RepID=M0L6T9_NATLA|nr:pyridoxal-phosphate dependent enzyme [Halobiforma lacisalsi]APW98167.1 pyridoxal-5'-phosphate-dependent protein subunit beta [Halobiforma lacisalsi AJ5]EMA28149.1 pyridoxal-5'-phosphate-dependent protein subunit beta [Halobiforma lacisalsi AJ5]
MTDQRTPDESAGGTESGTTGTGTGTGIGTGIDESTIFETPLLELEVDVPGTVYGKAEWFNLPEAPHGGGSIKSRIAKGMLDGAEQRGELEPDATIIEPTSGNTGSEIARLATARGYDVEIVMPDNASGGKIEAVRDAGAEIHFVDADLGYDAVIERCEELIAANPEDYYRPNQYENPDNPGTHERTTAREILEQTDGAVTHFVAGAGTGGTVTGTGRGLHDRGDDVTVVGFEPKEALHAIDGLKFLRTGDHYHPETYDESVLDRKEYVSTGDAYDRARDLRDRYQDAAVDVHDPGQHDPETVEDYLRVDGQFVVGTSSGAGIQAVHQLAEDGALDEDSVTVVMLCDRGDKYADIPLWEEYL